jgi:hypothetical protein
MHPDGKPFMKELAHRLGARWSSAHNAQKSVLEIFDIGGETRLESLRTVYRFSDGRCTEVERRRDCTPFDDRLIGMQLVAWVYENNNGPPTLHGQWRPGARGVLWRPASPGRSATVAMTSPTFAFVPDRMRTSDQLPAPPSRPPAESVTRVHAPLPMTG